MIVAGERADRRDQPAFISESRRNLRCVCRSGRAPLCRSDTMPHSLNLFHFAQPARSKRNTTPGRVTRAGPKAFAYGVTMMRCCFQADQNRRAITQKSLSKRPRLGRGCRRFTTASCCRSTRFSKARFPRMRKRRIRAPIQRKSMLSMARSYTRATIGSIVVSS